MVQQIFVSSSEFLKIVSNDFGQQRSRKNKKTRQSCLVTKHMALLNTFATFHGISRQHEQFFVCDNLYLSHDN